MVCNTRCGLLALLWALSTLTRSSSGSPGRLELNGFWGILFPPGRCSPRSGILHYLGVPDCDGDVLDLFSYPLACPDGAETPRSRVCLALHWDHCVDDRICPTLLAFRYRVVGVARSRESANGCVCIRVYVDDGTSFWTYIFQWVT